VVGWDGKVTYYLFTFTVQIAWKDEKTGLFRSKGQVRRGSLGVRFGQQKNNAKAA